MMRLVAFAICVLLSFSAAGQTCTTLGQNPSTAFPVCGTTLFKQQTVPLCGNRILPSLCKRDNVTDTNPFWYKFTCFQGGTLNFLITPNDLSEDYDWELFDVTGHNPNEVFVDGNLPVSCNWSGEPGITGTSASASQSAVCAGLGQPLFSKQPVLKANHNYLLLVSHFAPFTNSEEGYTLEFKGGSAVITDTKTPAIDSAYSNCSGNKVGVKLNKKMLCRSIADDGSDFYIEGYPTAIIGATGIGCSSKFDTDSVEILLAADLLPGEYTLRVKEGSDENTILDICNNPLPITETARFTVFEKLPTPMDSLVRVTCAPGSLTLIFSKNINCTSIAPDGSDFIITGSYPVSISGASGNCEADETREITIQLAMPITVAGDFLLRLKKGTDGNTIFNGCNVETPEGSSLAFSVKDTVNANFTYAIQYGCQTDLVSYFHPGANGVNSWTWNLDDNFTSNLQDPVARYTLFNRKDVQLIVSNGFCSDTSAQPINLDNYIKADFSVAEDNCPLEPIQMTSNAIGNIVTHHWDFGDGSSSDEASPNHIYARMATTRDFKIRYTITDGLGCTSSMEKTTRIYVSCIIDVPNAFSPNSDGRNDLLYPLNAVKAEQLTFTVYNRWGLEVFKTNNWKKGWDGRFKGDLQESGLYIWTLTFTDRDSKKQFSRKGKTLLIR